MNKRSYLACFKVVELFTLLVQYSIPSFPYLKSESITGTVNAIPP